jgi:Na+/alanine symporter
MPRFTPSILGIFLHIFATLLNVFLTVLGFYYYYSEICRYLSLATSKILNVETNTTIVYAPFICLPSGTGAS